MPSFRAAPHLLIWIALARGYAFTPREHPSEPPPARIGRLEFQGNRFFRSTELRSELRTRVGIVLSKADLDVDSEALRRKYQREGFLFAQARAVVREAARARGRVDVTFEVHEGYKVRLEEVTISGNRSFSVPKLITVSGLVPVRLFGLVSKGVYLSGSVTLALQRMKLFYISRGFFDVQVELESFRLDGRQRAVSIDVRVEEGRRFRLVGAEVSGQKVFPEDLLLREIDLETGDYYHGPDVEAAARRLTNWYLRASDLVPRIKATPRYGEDDEVTIVFEIDEGKHLFVGSVEVHGNSMTRDRVIRQHLRSVPGEPFVPTDVRRSAIALRRTGLFEDLEVSASPGTDEQIYDVDVRVKEKDRYRWIYIGGGASSGEGEVAYVRLLLDNFDLFKFPASLDDLEHAFIGGGQLLELEALPGTRESHFRFRFREPYFFSSSRALSLKAGTQIFARESYDENRVLGEAELRQYLDADHELSMALAYRVENVKIDDLKAAAPPDVLSAQGSTFLAYPRFSVLYDATELSLYSGPRGLLGEAVYDVADEVTGSRLDFSRLRLRADYFLPLLERHPDFRHTLHVGAEFGWLEGLDSEPVDLFERFYLGGPRSFRGFDYRRLGPHQMSTPVGGQVMIHGTVEYSMPLFLREVRAVALFDWGNLEPDFDGFSTGRFRTAVGGGLQIRWPMPFSGQIVPFNLYWVQSLSTEAGDAEQLFTFTLGFGF